MLLTTTPTIQGKEIKVYKGVVVGTAILGVNFIKDMLAGISDVVGGRSTSYEKEMARAQEIAFKEIQINAKRVKANAIVAIDIDYEIIGEKGSMMMVSISGTAVII